MGNLLRRCARKMRDGLRSLQGVRRTTRVRELRTRVAELERKLSVVDGRSSLNAERNVRTHASLQNLAEDFEPVKQHVDFLVNGPADEALDEPMPTEPVLDETTTGD